MFQQNLFFDINDKFTTHFYFMLVQIYIFNINLLKKYLQFIQTAALSNTEVLENSNSATSNPFKKENYKAKTQIVKSSPKHVRGNYWLVLLLNIV